MKRDRMVSRSEGVVAGIIVKGGEVGVGEGC